MNISFRTRLFATATLCALIAPAAISQTSISDTQSAAGADETRRLPPVEVRADGTFAVEAATTATKTDTPLILTPATIQVVPEQVLRDQGVGSSGLNRALRNAGVSTQGTLPSTESMNFRGFYSTVTLWNGFRIEDISTTAGPGWGGVWMDNVERLEVMKGPTSVLYGRNEPGGAVNVITKRPDPDRGGEIKVAAGSWEHRAAVLDLSGSVSGDSSARARLTISQEDAGSFFRYAPDYSSFGVAPSLEWQATPYTNIIVEGFYRQLSGSTGGSGMPLDPSTNALYGPVENSLLVSNFAEFEQTRLYAHLQHELNRNWKLSGKILRTEASSPPITSDYIYTGYFPAVSDEELIIDRFIGRVVDSERDLTAASLDLVGEFSVLGLDHTVLVGADHYTRNASFTSYWSCCHPTNYFDQAPLTPVQYETAVDGFDPSISPGYSYSGDAVYNNTDTAIYIQDQIALPGNLHLLLGMRYQRINEDTATNFVAGDPLEYKPEVSLEMLTPRIGVLWNPREWLSFYYSYGENSGSNNGLAFPNIPLDPETATQHEAGFKSVLFGGRLNASLALFDLTKTNVATEDPFNAGFVIPVGEVRSRGAELSIQGEIAPDWSIILNVSDARPEVIEGTGTLPKGALLPFLANTTANAWTSYNLPSTIAKGWRVGGGVDWASDANPAPGDSLAAPSYLTASAFASYETEFNGQLVSFQLNVDNVFDKEHYNLLQGLDVFGIAGVNIGTPRRVLLTVRTAW